MIDKVIIQHLDEEESHLNGRHQGGEPNRPRFTSVYHINKPHPSARGLH